ncbi:unnamed protein product [Tilletia controversa]|nr:unnamed protein product [Tilletia controversa]
MPAVKKTADEVRAAVGEYFEVLEEEGSGSIQVHCKPCAWEGNRPSVYRSGLVEDHIKTARHKRNLRLFQRPREDENENQRQRDLTPDNAGAADEAQLGADPDGGPDDFWAGVNLPQWYASRNEHVFWQLADERDDVVASLQEEMAQLRRDDEALLARAGPSLDRMVAEDVREGWESFESKQPWLSF